MKTTHGNILTFFGVVHSILAISPWGFGKQFYFFAHSYFYKITEGLYEFPLLNGVMNYEEFAAFWFFYFGLMLIPLGILLDGFEKLTKQIPSKFLWSYFVVVIVGVYMIPFSGMTMFMLPHSIYMLAKRETR